MFISLADIFHVVAIQDVFEIFLERRVEAADCSYLNRSKFADTVAKALSDGDGALTNDQRLAAESHMQSVKRFENGESDDPYSED